MLEARTQAGSGLQGGSGNRGSRTVRQANRNKAREDVLGCNSPFYDAAGSQRRRKDRIYYWPRWHMNDLSGPGCGPPLCEFISCAVASCQ